MRPSVRGLPERIVPNATSAARAVELVQRDAAADVFGAAKSVRTIRDGRLLRRLIWTVDIGVDVEGVGVAIEYDGAYWHVDKLGLDSERAETSSPLAHSSCAARASTATS